MKLRNCLTTLLTLCAAWSGFAFGGTLAEVPLSLRGSVPSNVLFDISVEWPTAITAAYNDVSGYDPDIQYEGLVDPNLCYDYDGNLGSTATPPLNPPGGFVPKATAAGHKCTGRWSGNFLNWATMTGLDAFRYATTGGNRAVDTPVLTVLERTFVSNQGMLFPDKTFNPLTGKFVGATPFTVNTTYTMVNGRQAPATSTGIRMILTGTETTTSTTTGSGSITCTKANSPTYCTSITLGSDGSSGTCSAWATTGSNDGSASTKPIKCTAFGTFSSGATTITAINSCTSTAKNGQNKYVCTGYGVNLSKTVTNTNNVNNTYNVRVEACNKTYPLRENCQQYGNVYKPVGEIQRNGEKMRFGAFAYYNAADIDNAVMRSKLKYVAPNRYASSAATAANPNKEWNEADGTFIQNPDPTEATNSHGGAVANSGVINYLNKFGRQSGNYKTYDNFGKMYYESMRYLRKLPPTQAFYEYSSPANNDDFPVITDWYRDNDDPIKYTCQKNYIITMGDQFTHCDKRLPGGTITPFSNHDPANPGSTRGDWCGNAYNSHNTNDQGSLNNGDPLDLTTLTNDLGTMEIPPRPTLGAERTGSGGNASFLVAGLAHWAATNDVRPDLEDTVPDKNGGFKPQTVKTFVIDVEENAALGVNTQFWYMAKYGGSDEYSNTGAPLNWSTNVNYTTSAEAPFTNSYVGPWPKSLLRAGNPASMIASIKAALASIEGDIGSSSALSQSQTDLRTSDGAFIYRAIFNSDLWSGDLQAYEIDRNGALSNTPAWSAGPLLTAMPQSNRVVFTFNDGLNPDGTPDTTPGNKNKRPVRFDPDNFTTDLSPRQRDFLNHDSLGTADNLAADRMRYLLGSASNEGTDGHKWRARVPKNGTAGDRNILGDIINSSPKYVGRPQFGLPGNGYNEFAQEVKDRKPMIYVGSNDGMLHGFDATKPGTLGATPGTELIAYVPGTVYSRLNHLMAPNYNHKYFVDGSPTVSEACFGSCAGKSDWKTVLVGGLNAGGQGIYALDVTNPSNFSGATAADVVLWEFSDRDDPDLGYTFSQPVIQLMNNGKWAVIFGNGFNNTASDGKPSGTGRAYLYILLVDGPGSGNAWIKDTNYFKIELKSPSEPATATLPIDPANGLASVTAIDRDLNDTADYIYAGDRNGNLWKIDVSSSDYRDWKPDFGTASDPQPLFKANYPNTSGTPVPQPITTGVTVSGHPNGGFMVMFGTGTFIEASDNLGPFKTDSYYGIWDKDDATATTQGTTVTRDKLQQQKVVDTLSVGTNTFLFQSTCLPNYNDTTDASNENGNLCPSDIAYTNSGQQLGWFFNLPDNGERTAAAYPVLDSSVLTFTTLTPSEDPCTGNTIGREYHLNYLTGGATPTSVFDLDGNGRIDAGDLFTVPGLGSQGVGVAASGIKLTGGKSEPGASFQLPRITDTTNTTSYACPDFIPGWGCPSEMAPQRNCQKWTKNFKSQASVSIASGGSLGVSGGHECRVGKAGRFTWRQITK